MKKKIIGIAVVCLSAIFLLAGAYFLLTYYYSKDFTCGVWVNGVYCTGYDVATVNKILAEKNEYQKITVTAKNGDAVQIDTQEVDFRLDYTESLKEIQQKQSPYKWIYYYYNPVHYEAVPQVQFDEEKVAKALGEAGFMQQGIYKTGNTASVKWSEDGYVLVDNTVSLLHDDKAEETVIAAIETMQPQVNLEEAGCYENLPMTKAVYDTYQLWDKINEFQSFTVTYQMGKDVEKIDESVVSKWILLDETGNFVFDENGDLILNEDKVLEYTKSLGEKYDTVGKPREFKTTKGEVVTIEFSKYGNDLDEEKEAKALIEAFYNKQSGEIREPIYKTKAKSQGADDIGGTYIEVDMTAQQLYFYQDYELKLESGVVTGNMRLNHDTPAMIAPIYYMQKNRVLRGDGYASFVYYWMAFYRGYGLHDATWRRESEFGTDTYLRNGSHGCVNLPKSVAAELYEYIDIGTPVITYY